ncbi:Mu-like prophage FluMu protein gp41 [Providencia alcalifaciens RIMD 1656011]|uniref:Phage tail protein E n=1 Tax=Providencia alcalifaciens DSM 30120 TaxID=520999 RepID=B6XAD4_9GAMM|nr:phage tail assembly protein [Providencia alcalifaciens]ATG14942.1 phage tail assembly protein [Providencia alcalifaciens]EEB47687.1 phage tail protein E [Providencia alcalifaciens DSM 30120]ETT00134.1 Mu-like prophage FluMu protein gp41 [Providencia alcalifaciens PAL-3]EUC97716.1 Mu-like prophage FluMu protein gp41 [Providencia alcalifaciens PAL-1]EUD04558.1 Mu-like prophage FluMu protein gp41 [Providencia alcalifaciens RIMD 1656011]
MEQTEKNQITVVLDEPLTRGETTISEIVVRKPNSGALRGVRLAALIEMDVDSAMLVLPRVTTPALTKSEILMMNPADMMSLTKELVFFLLPKSVTTDSQSD